MKNVYVLNTLTRNIEEVVETVQNDEGYLPSNTETAWLAKYDIPEHDDYEATYIAVMLLKKALQVLTEERFDSGCVIRKGEGNLYYVVSPAGDEGEFHSLSSAREAIRLLESKRTVVTA